MTHDWSLYFCLFLALWSEIVGGVFSAFSEFIMSTLLKAEPASGIEAMRHINRDVIKTQFVADILSIAVFSVLFALYSFVAFDGAALVTLILASLAFAALDQGWGKSSIAKKGDLSGFELAAREIAEQDNQGNVSFILIGSGAPVADFHLSKGKEVNAQSVFQVASLGKWVTAWGVMALVEDGRVDLDAPVSNYLTRWQLRASEFDASGVTVRRLLSHTAGLTDGLGNNGFATEQERQTL